MPARANQTSWRTHESTTKPRDRKKKRQDGVTKNLYCRGRRSRQGDGFQVRAGEQRFRRGTKKRGTDHPAAVVVQDQGSYYTAESSLSRIPVPLKAVPQSITVIPQRLMQERAAASFQDALRSVPGISFQAGEGGVQGNNLTLRGYNARNDIFIDGVRDQGSYFRDIFNIESIEVLKGPSSLYFGRGSTGGAINQVSKVPQLTPSYGGAFSLGNGIYLRGTGDVNQPITPTIAFRVNLMAHKDDIVGRDISEQQRLGFAPSISFGLGTPTQLTLSYLIQGEDNIPDYGVPYVGNKPARVDRNNFYGFQFRLNGINLTNDQLHEIERSRIRKLPRTTNLQEELIPRIRAYRRSIRQNRRANENML
ncbi:MAG: TonB-dependent receptor [Candidatus Binatia bacterium]